MKKTLVGILGILLILTLALAGCSSNTTGDTTTESDTTTEEVTVEKPVSDVSGGTALEGTWEGEETVGDEDDDETVVLALNSDKKFDLYVENVGEDNSETGMFSGTYDYTDTTIDLKADDFTGTLTVDGTSITADNINAVDEDQTFSYSYTLDGDHLVLTSDDSTLDLKRMEAANE